MPTVETSCQQIVDCLVRTAVPAVSGPSVSVIVLLCISSVHLLHDVVVASSAEILLVCCFDYGCTECTIHIWLQMQPNIHIQTTSNVTISYCMFVFRTAGVPFEQSLKTFCGHAINLKLLVSGVC